MSGRFTAKLLVKIATVRRIGFSNPSPGITVMCLFLALLLSVSADAQDYSDRNIFVNHIGFLPKAAKTAIMEGTSPVDFRVIEIHTGSEVYRGRMNLQEGDFGTFLVGDFSKLATEGNYEVRTAGGCSVPFKIANNIYQNALQKHVSYFSSQRCGPSTTGYRGPCHLDDGLRLDNGKHQDVSGGWHDASDLRKWCGSTILGMIGMSRVSETLNPEWDYGQIVEELRWGNRYFLKMQEPAGYIMKYCAGDEGNRTSDNVSGNEDDRYIHTESGGPCTQFNFIAAQAAIVRLTRENDPAYADTCWSAALRCLEWCRREKICKNTQNLASAIFSCTELHRTSGNDLFRDLAADYARRLLELQITDPIDSESPVRGFFLTSPDNPEPFKNIWLGSQALIGLCQLLEDSPDHPDAPSWKKGITLYCKDYLEAMSGRTAFNIVPYGFYTQRQGGNRHIGKYGYRWFMGLKESKEIVYDEDFEVTNVAWIWNGINANLASAGVGLIKASRLLDDPTLETLAQRQLDWILGANPFNASTVSGVGYNQPAQFVTGSFRPPTPVIPGAVMNGIGGTEDDEPDLKPGSWQTCEYWTPMICYTMWLETEIQNIR